MLCSHGQEQETSDDALVTWFEERVESIICEIPGASYNSIDEGIDFTVPLQHNV